MANEISLGVTLACTNGGYNNSFQTQSAYTQTTKGAAAGILSVSTTATNIPTVTTLGYTVLKNLDSATAVDVGINSSGFVAFASLKAGETAVFRWKAGVTPQAKTASGTILLQHWTLND